MLGEKGVRFSGNRARQLTAQCRCKVLFWTYTYLFDLFVGFLTYMDAIGVPRGVAASEVW